jgi:hypothetical protein
MIKHTLLMATPKVSGGWITPLGAIVIGIVILLCGWLWHINKGRFMSRSYEIYTAIPLLGKAYKRVVSYEQYKTYSTAPFVMGGIMLIGLGIYLAILVVAK